MNDQAPTPQPTDRVAELLLDSRTRTLTSEERAGLNRLLRDNQQACRAAAQLLMDDAILAEELRAGHLEALLSLSGGGMIGPASSHFVAATKPAAQSWWRPWVGVAAGLVLGIGAAGSVLALDPLRSAWTWWKVDALQHGDFTMLSGNLPSGYPTRSGRWTGDPATIETPLGEPSASAGPALRLLAPGVDRSNPAAPAKSCDVLQVVDLTQVQQRVPADQHATLVLSVLVRDDRPAGAATLRFSLRLYCYGEDATAFIEVWPRNLEAALSSGQSVRQSVGGDPAWQELSTRAALPPAARFAVVQVVATPVDQGVPWQTSLVLGRQWVDDVRLEALVFAAGSAAGARR